MIIPFSAGVAQEGARVLRPSILTAQRKQEAAGGKFSTLQSVGIRIPAFEAASRTVIPSSTSIFLPLISNVIIAGSFSFI